MTRRSTSEICNEIVALFETGGTENYFGEPVTQLAHALQAADLASRASADPETVLAALFHDIGHLLEGQNGTETGVIDHDLAGRDWLRERGFSERLAALVGGHVAAKRYLVATHPHYRQRLSAASIETLRMQGGPMSDAEARAFEKEPLFAEMLRLRSWDEQAKDPEAEVPPLGSYREMIVDYLERQP